MVVDGYCGFSATVVDGYCQLWLGEQRIKSVRQGCFGSPVRPITRGRRNPVPRSWL